MTTVDRKEVFIMQKLQGKCGCNTIYKEHYYSDTINNVYRDSIFKPYKVTDVKTVNKLHWWQKGFLWVGIAAIIALITGIFIRLKKLIG